MDKNPMNQNQEIDLVYIYRAFGRFFINIGLCIYDFLMLVKRNAIVLAALVLVGFGLGFYLDSNQEKVLRHDFIVVPNFGSADFLYEAFDKNAFITTKLNNEEWLNLKEVRKIKIEPVEDVYNLLKNNIQAVELIKTLSDRGIDLNSLLTNKSTRKNYKYHLLSIYTMGTHNTQDIIEDVFDQLNSQEYFLKKQGIAQIQNQVKKKETQRSLEQMNNLLDNFGAADKHQDAKGVSIKTLPEVENLFYRKNNIMEDLVMLDEEIMEQQKTVYIAGKIMNIYEDRIWDRQSIFLPLKLLALFFLAIGFKIFIKKFRLIKQSRAL